MPNSNTICIQVKFTGTYPNRREWVKSHHVVWWWYVRKTLFVMYFQDVSGPYRATTTLGDALQSSYRAAQCEQKLCTRLTDRSSHKTSAARQLPNPLLFISWPIMYVNVKRKCFDKLSSKASPYWLRENRRYFVTWWFLSDTV